MNQINESSLGWRTVLATVMGTLLGVLFDKFLSPAALPFGTIGGAMLFFFIDHVFDTFVGYVQIISQVVIQKVGVLVNRSPRPKRSPKPYAWAWVYDLVNIMMACVVFMFMMTMAVLLDLWYGVTQAAVGVAFFWAIFVLATSASYLFRYQMRRDSEWIITPHEFAAMKARGIWRHIGKRFVAAVVSPFANIIALLLFAGLVVAALPLVALLLLGILLLAALKSMAWAAYRSTLYVPSAIAATTVAAGYAWFAMAAYQSAWWYEPLAGILGLGAGVLTYRIVKVLRRRGETRSRVPQLAQAVENQLNAIVEEMSAFGRGFGGVYGARDDVLDGFK